MRWFFNLLNGSALDITPDADYDPMADADTEEAHPMGRRALGGAKSDFDPHDLNDSATALGQSDYNKMAMTGFVVCVSALLLWLVIIFGWSALTSQKADAQQAAGQLVGYQNTPPLSPIPLPAAPSSSADTLPLQEILTGVPPLSPTPDSKPIVIAKEAH